MQMHVWEVTQLDTLMGLRPDIGGETFLHEYAKWLTAPPGEAWEDFIYRLGVTAKEFEQSLPF